MADKRVVLTEEGLKKLEEKLEYLKSVRRLEVAERLKAAIALGDLSENSEYDDAKNEQAFIEGEILTLESQIRNSEIIKADDSNKDVVHLGNTVVIKDMEYDEDETYTIVGSTEADILQNKISNEAPIGRALLGKKIGDVVSVEGINQVNDFRVIDVQRK